MAKIYARLILEGKMQLDDVPHLWRDAVAKMIGEA